MPALISFIRSLYLLFFLVSRVICGLQQHGETFEPDQVLHVTHDTIPMACNWRDSVLVNGSTPGPAIHIKANETTWIRVYNDMVDQNLTIHWHGLSQSVAPFSDGTPRASQWPIPPLHFFDYELHPSSDEPGTYFYHSHVGFQASSCAGPLIVEDPDDELPPYEYDDERVFFLSEYYPWRDEQIVEGLQGSPINWPGEAQAILVNGNSPPANNSADTGVCVPEVFQVEPDKTYRFRVIGGTALFTITFGFEAHNNLTIIEVDGSYTQLYETDHIQVGSGQRFDFLLHTKTASEIQASGQTEYWIQIETRYRPIPFSSWARLSYSANPPQQLALPSGPLIYLTEDIYSWLEYALQPLVPNDFPSLSEVTRRVTITAQQILANGTAFSPTVPANPAGQVDWNIENRTWEEEIPDTTPYLVSIYENGQAAIPNYTLTLQYGGWDPILNVFAAHVGEVLEIVWLNEPNDNMGGLDLHPLHAHGGHFYDIGSGNGTYDVDANEAKLQALNYHPVKRDTTILYKYTPGDELGAPAYSVVGWRAWRLRITEADAGVWMIHCHTLQHMVMGMQTVWVMGDADQITEKQLNLTLTGYLTYGGSAYGNASYAPIVNHYYDED